MWLMLQNGAERFDIFVASLVKEAMSGGKHGGYEVYDKGDGFAADGSRRSNRDVADGFGAERHALTHAAP
jgi:hypothetical protein